MRRFIFPILSIEFCILIFIISIIYVKSSSKEPSITPPSLSKKTNLFLEKAVWKQYMQQVGPKKAYADFIRIYKPSSPSLQHEMIHIIGGLIYEIAGIEGIGICDDTYVFGCYHGFLGNAIKQGGISKIHALNSACSTATSPGGCRHGLGHGLLAYLGTEELPKALEFCDTLTWQQPIGGCKGGVYMEYNFNNISHTTEHVRPLNSQPYSPCSELPSVYQYSCFYWLPDWWDNVYKGNYKEMGGLCQNLEEKNRKICFQGVGGVAARSSAFDLQKTVAKCNTMPSHNTQALCKKGAREVFNMQQSPLDQESINRICDSSFSLYRNICLGNIQL